MPRTGIASVAAAVAAVEAHDLSGLLAQVRYVKVACVSDADRGGLDPRPPCRGGERTGDLVDGWLVAQCEGMYLRPGSGAIGDELARYLKEPLPFSGAYRTPADWGAGILYTAVFSGALGAPNLATVVLLDDAGIVGIGTGCGQTAADLGAAMRATPLAVAPASPLPTPSPVASVTALATPVPRTGIASVDAAVAAVEAHDLPALLAQVRYTVKRCAVTPPQVSDTPRCLSSERDGTLVDVFPSPRCEPFNARPDAVPMWLGGLTDPNVHVYAVYRLAPDSLFPLARYDMVVFRDSPAGPTGAFDVILGDAGIVGTRGCGGGAPAEWVRQRPVGAVVLPPAR